jgi:hypothetical protein
VIAFRSVQLAAAAGSPGHRQSNPVFFIGTTFAIHGDTDVPRRPASHGCVRIPTHVAAFFHTLVPTPGTPVYIRR